MKIKSPLRMRDLQGLWSLTHGTVQSLTLTRFHTEQMHATWEEIEGNNVRKPKKIGGILEN